MKIWQDVWAIPIPWCNSVVNNNFHMLVYLTIIPRARMGSGSIAYEGEGRMGY